VAASRFYSRRGYDWTGQFEPIARAADILRRHDVVIDGEVVVLNNAGAPDFNLLRHETGKKDSLQLQFRTFDLLYLDGYDLRRCRLDDRKDALRRLLAAVPPPLVYHHSMSTARSCSSHAQRQNALPPPSQGE
jgi:bifunctional non-homologous end joining protein LigD